MACWNIVQGYTPNYIKLTPTHLLWYTCVIDITVLPRKINHLSGDINWFVEIVVRLVLHVITALLAAYLLAWPPFRVHCAQRICTLSSHFFFFFFWSSKMSAKKNILLPPDQWYACVCVCVCVHVCVCLTAKTNMGREWEMAHVHLARLSVKPWGVCVFHC